MVRRQQRLEQIGMVAQEFLAAKTAAEWLQGCQDANPGFGDQYGWEAKAAIDFRKNLEATYIIRMYAEFEAGLRDYWKTHRKRRSHPQMLHLIRDLIPNQSFSQDIIDRADDVRKYRNHLVHDMEEALPEGVMTFSVAEAKRCLCAYFGRLDARWK